MAVSGARILGSNESFYSLFIVLLRQLGLMTTVGSTILLSYCSMEAESEGQCLRGVLLGRQNLRGSV